MFSPIEAQQLTIKVIPLGNKMKKPDKSVLERIRSLPGGI